VSAIIPLRDGTLLVNFPTRAARQIAVIDTSLKLVRIVADTMPLTDIQYGFQAGGLLRYLADSSLYVEPGSPTIYVIDPAGKYARTLSAPNPRDAVWLVNSVINNIGTDARGRIIYRSLAPRPPSPKPNVGETLDVSYPDSAPIMRSDIVTRKTEVARWVRTRLLRGKVTGRPDGTSMQFSTNDPTAAMDDYAVLSDGTIAIVKKDFHLELVDGDGKVSETPRIPYPWVRLSDSDKVALIDSLRREANKPGPRRMIGGGGGSAAPPPSLPGDTVPDYAFAKPETLGDYLPAFDAGSLRPDATGNLWVRTLQKAPTPGMVVYYVISREGVVIDRVEIPNTKGIAGFDRDHVYLAPREGPPFLERVRIH
jgi:hypothetical protein